MGSMGTWLQRAVCTPVLWDASDEALTRLAAMR
jgi:hypothetical protein